MNNFSVNTRLFLLVALLSVVSIIVGLMGLKGMSTTVSGLQTVYEDRVVPLRDLKVIADLYAVNIVDTTHKVRNGNIEWAEARKNLQDARQGIDKTWTAYKATFLVEQEKKLVATIEPMLSQAESTINELQSILEKEDMRAITSFTIETLYPVIDPISNKFSELIEVQLDVAKAEYTASREQYEQSRMISMVLLIAGTLMGVILARGSLVPLSNPCDWCKKQHVRCRKTLTIRVAFKSLKTTRSVKPREPSTPYCKPSKRPSVKSLRSFNTLPMVTSADALKVICKVTWH